MPAPTTRKILVVDDEQNVLNALRRTLRREGYEVYACTDPQEALTLLPQMKPDLVLSDHLMPNMTGLEFLKRVRTRFPDTVRIMLTGHADMQTAIDAINQGEIYRFLTKPWDDAELKVTLHLALEQLDLQRENRRLLALLRQQGEVIARLELSHPGIATIVRDETGAILLDETAAQAS